MVSVSQIISYTRLSLIFGSWLLVTDYPNLFAGLYGFQHLLYVFQQASLNKKTESELSKQLRILVTRLGTSILLFAVIKQSLDHSKHKLMPKGIKEADIPEYMKTASIDEKT